jgi:hypothetical protein
MCVMAGMQILSEAGDVGWIRAPVVVNRLQPQRGTNGESIGKHHREMVGFGGGHASGQRLSVLLLCDNDAGHPATTLEHIEALHRYPHHDVRIFNPRGVDSSKYLDLSEFDVVVLHYSLIIISDYYLAPHFREQIRRFEGLKILFIQDEYRWINKITAMIRHLGINVLFTLMPPSEVSKVYNETTVPGVKIVETLAGYVSDSLMTVQPSPPDDRPIDIGYRGRTVPYWLGRHAQEKAWIGQELLGRAGQYGLRCDIRWGEQDRIYGAQWIRFLHSCKATLGTESGASIADFDGSIERRTNQYLGQHPLAGFDEVWKDFLEPYEGNIRYFMISPRVFEAAALRTALILFPGHYSGIIRPWTHYIPLAKDYSNMDEVIDRVRDIAFLRSMTDRTYQDLVASGQYSQRVLARELDNVIAQYPRKARRRIKLAYRLATLERPAAWLALQARRVVENEEDRARRALYNVCQGAVSLALTLSSPAGRQILFRWIANPTFRRGVALRHILRDVLKLAVLGQTSNRSASRRAMFDVRPSLDVAQGILAFVSYPLKEAGRDRNDSPVRDEMGSALRAAILKGHVRKVIWNHSDLEGAVRFAVTSSIGFSVSVGDANLYSFDALVTLGQRAPREVLRLFADMLHLNGGAIAEERDGQILTQAR